jgi:UDP-N-acetyl-D-glucosamine 4,6-dehydratase
MKTYILGKNSYLSNKLKKKIKNCFVFSLQDKSLNNINFNNSNIIINSFYSSLKLDQINNYESFVNKSIYEVSKFLDQIKKYNINKIIYTSSSSVYNSINEEDLSDERNRKLYASTKYNTENLLKNFCHTNNIRLNITRIFNIFGNEEKFSIISKIINCYKSNKDQLDLINNGESIRDFIHIDNVVNIYKQLLKSKDVGIIDIGSGFGFKISDIIKLLGKQNFKIRYLKKKESNFSIAQNVKFELDKKKSLENFLRKKLRLRKNIHFDKIFSNKKNLFQDYVQGSIIYGGGEAGRKLLKIYKQTNKDFVSFFVDDKKKYFKKRTIDGKKILSFQELVKLSKTKIINNIIIAIPSLSPLKLRNLIDKITPLTMNISIVNSNLFGQNSYLNLSDVTDTILSNLLKRKPIIKLNLQKTISKKTILITGAGGSIGSELVKQAMGSGSKVIALDHSELALYNLEKSLKENFNLKNIKIILGSILDKKLLKFINENNNIDIVFHAAAYKHVNILENNISLAIKNNIFGTLNILNQFNKKKLKIVIISTDKAARPKSILGATKRISEIICQNFQKSSLYYSDIKIVRFGNVFGSKGSAIELFIEQINKQLPITLTDYSAKRYFMSIREACNLVIQSTTLSNKGKIFILNMGKQVFMRDIIFKLAEMKNIRKEELNIKKIGLNKGEKLSEELSIGKQFLKTSNKDIFEVNEPLYEKNKIQNLISQLDKNIYSQNQEILKKIIFSFLVGEK